jgi:hypothetical protein
MREKCPLLDSISRLPRLHASASRPTIACAGFAEQYLSSSVGPRIAYGKLQAESCSAHWVLSARHARPHSTQPHPSDVESGTISGPSWSGVLQPHRFLVALRSRLRECTYHDDFSIALLFLAALPYLPAWAEGDWIQPLQEITAGQNGISTADPRRRSPATSRGAGLTRQTKLENRHVLLERMS